VHIGDGGRRSKVSGHDCAEEEELDWACVAR
jgi:hypothetical protein